MPEPDKTLITRASADVVPSTINEETRTVTVVGATESPCMVFDPERWDVVKEVLLMSGCQIPRSGKIPLTVEHDRHASAVIGSFQRLRAEGDQLVGDVVMSSSDDAEPFWIKLKEGHLDKFSIVYPITGRVSTWIPEGETSEIEGRTYTGPILITTKWTPRSLGIVLYPADERAQARSKDAVTQTTSKSEETKMNDKLRKFLERSGLPATATEEEAWAFMDTLKTPADKDNERKEAERAAIEAERGRVSEIRAMCEKVGAADLTDKLIKDGSDLDAARAAVLDHIATKQTPDPGTRKDITLGADERDKYRSACTDALMLRGDLKIETPAPGATDLRGLSLVEMARHSLRVAGQTYSGRPLEMVGRALTTSDFPYILANVAHKALFEGFETADETWNIWCATGSVSDFKTHYSQRISETDDLETIGDGEEYKYGSQTEAQESYAIATYGKLFAITRQTIINDDLNAILRVSARGEAAARKIGDVAYAVLTGNADMGDSTALFHADHSNFIANGSGGAPGVATIAAGILAMGTQTDAKGLRRLNIRPQFFIAPKALEGTAEVFFRSERFTDSSTVETDSSLAATRVNPYSGNYFTRVYDPRLDDDDAAAWYLAARKGKTVTVFFLDGVQTPYLETQNGWSVDGVEYKVRIDAGAKALDWRGLYFNDGN